MIAVVHTKETASIDQQLLLLLLLLLFVKLILLKG